MKKITSKHSVSSSAKTPPVATAAALGPLYVEFYTGTKSLREIEAEVHRVESRGFRFHDILKMKPGAQTNAVIFEKSSSVTGPVPRLKLSCTTAPEGAQIIHSEDLVVEGDIQTVKFWRIKRPQPRVR